MIRLGIVGSTRGTNMLHIIDSINNGRLDATIEVVVSNKVDALILERARLNGLNAEFISSVGMNRSEFDTKITEVLLAHRVELVVLIGYMRILSTDFVSAWSERVINVHPSLLPAFSGMMDLDVHQAVINAGVHETGCTVHYVIPEVDAGPIILQKKCPVLEGDTALILKERVQQLEGPALVEAIQNVDQRVKISNVGWR